MFCATVHVVVSQVLLWKFCAGNWWSWPRLILKPMLDVWQLCCGLVKNFPKELEHGWKVKCTTISSASRVSNVGTTIWVQAGIACPIWIHREKKKCFFDFDHHFRDHKDAFARSRIPQANQVPAVRWSSCEIRVMAKLWEFVWECLQTLLWIKKIQSILNKNTSLYFHSASLVIWPLTMLKRTHFSELSISRFTT